MMVNKQVIQEKVYELYGLNHQVQSMQHELKVLDNNLAELGKLKESLDDFEKNNEKEVFSHLGGGVFIKAELKDKNKVLVNVGGNVLVNKNIKEANDIIEKQGEETGKVIQRLDSEINLFAKRMSDLEKEIEKLGKKK